MITVAHDSTVLLDSLSERNLAVTEYMVRELAAMRKDLVEEIRELRSNSGA
ncbi:MAG: hypothetical protein ACO2YW_03875 [Candidatus Nanopelagicaceae bacterium]